MDKADSWADPVPRGARNPARISVQRRDWAGWTRDLQQPQAELGFLEKLAAPQRAQ